MLSIEELKARIRKAPIGKGGDTYLKVEKNILVTFHVLPGEFGADGLFYQQIATHFLNKKRIGCTAIHGLPCHICDQLKQDELTLVDMKKEYESELISNPRQAEQTKATYEAGLEDLQRSKPQKKFVFNVLVKDEESPVFLKRLGAFSSSSTTISTIASTNTIWTSLIQRLRWVSRSKKPGTVS